MTRLSGMQYLAYWVYAMTFLIITFFILTNFFLAIVVDAFAAVNEELKEFKADNSYLSDLLDISGNVLRYSTNWTWPRQGDVIQWLDRRGKLKPKKNRKTDAVTRVLADALHFDGHEEFCTEPITSKEFREKWPKIGDDALVRYIVYYANK